MIQGGAVRLGGKATERDSFIALNGDFHCLCDCRYYLPQINKSRLACCAQIDVIAT